MLVCCNGPHSFHPCCGKENGHSIFGSSQQARWGDSWQSKPTMTAGTANPKCTNLRHCFAPGFKAWCKACTHQHNTCTHRHNTHRHKSCTHSHSYTAMQWHTCMRAWTYMSTHTCTSPCVCVCVRVCVHVCVCVCVCVCSCLQAWMLMARTLRLSKRWVTECSTA